ncbi:polycystic kidney disease protein 1-like 2 [Patella vulgata]|uniref:polycystic kidney disease protein 1-like 2 n=1 Tax=Patella vulgata TaxID=6465 RepID=UPI00217F4D6E|nr:polycystic kidney disease protein 1-like 2 [Patella vulgata]
MFMEHATSQITDEHIWLSVLFRPVKSNFTRVQRVGCCITLLFLCMISNAMFFETGDNKDRQRASSIELGPIKFNPSQVYISLVCSVLTAIPVYVIMMLFRKSKQKPWERKKKKIPHWLPNFMREKLEFSQKLEDILVISDNIAIKDAILPTWCVYIGWFLVFVASFLACFFIILYSMEWGKDLSEEWLTTFFLSFIESLMFVDPFKVLFLAVIAGILLKTLKINRPTKYDLKEITDMTTKHGKIKIERRQTSSYQPTQDQDFKHIKAQKLRDNQMKNVIKELILNILFLFLLSCILYSNRDTQSYNLHTYIQDNFLDPPKPYRMYDKVIQSSHYFEWMNKTALPALFPETDYRGIRMTATQRRFSYNSANLKVGPPRLRQVRARIGNCSYPYIGHTTCIPAYEVMGEDTGNYCPTWKPQPCSDAEESTLTIDAWKFTSATSIWGAPIAGLLTLYGGGGYIANLDVNKIVSTESLNEIFKNRWIDRQTRAVFFEFTLYNIDINMFVYVSILTEFPETGGVVTYENIFPFRPSQHEGTLGKFILVCEIVTMVYIAVSVILMGIRFAKQKWLFFSKFWNIVEFIMVGVSLVAMVFYILRIQYTSQALAAFEENDREFVNFYHVVIWDYAFVYVLGVLVTIATLRLLKAMAYTDITFKVFSVLGQTIKVFPGFATFIGINLLSFSSAGYFLFGRTGDPYKSVITCMETMFVGLMGDPTFKTTGAEVAMSHMETIYFSLFVIGVTILLTNLFLAILMDVMNRSIEDPPSKQEVDMNVFSYMWQSMTRVITGKQPDYTYRYKEENDVTREDDQQMTYVTEYKDPSKLSMSLLNIKQFETKRPFDQKMSIYEKLSSLNGTIE